MDFHLVRTKDHYIDVIVPLKKEDFFLTSFFNDFTYFTRSDYYQILQRLLIFQSVNTVAISQNDCDIDC